MVFVSQELWWWRVIRSDGKRKNPKKLRGLEVKDAKHVRSIFAGPIIQRCCFSPWPKTAQSALLFVGLGLYTIGRIMAKKCSRCYWGFPQFAVQCLRLLWIEHSASRYQFLKWASVWRSPKWAKAAGKLLLKILCFLVSMSPWKMCTPLNQSDAQQWVTKNDISELHGFSDDIWRLPPPSNEHNGTSNTIRLPFLYFLSLCNHEDILLFEQPLLEAAVTATVPSHFPSNYWNA